MLFHNFTQTGQNTMKIGLTLLCFCGLLLFGHGQTEKQLFKRGLEKLGIQDFEGAEIDFSMVLKLNPRNDVAYFNRAFARQKLGDHTGAIQDFSLALDINPVNPEGYFRRGNSKLDLEDYLGALQDFNICIRGRPKEHKYYQGRAMAKSGLQDFRGAITDLTYAIRLTKGKEMVYIFDRADAFINLKEFEKAVKDLDRVVKSKPNDPGAYNARASIKLRGGDLDGACLDWSKAGELGDVNAYGLIRKHCNN